jgi:hypothetical protein
MRNHESLEFWLTLLALVSAIGITLFGLWLIKQVPHGNDMNRHRPLRFWFVTMLLGIVIPFGILSNQVSQEKLDLQAKLTQTQSEVVALKNRPRFLYFRQIQRGQLPTEPGTQVGIKPTLLQPGQDLDIVEFSDGMPGLHDVYGRIVSTQPGQLGYVTFDPPLSINVTADELKGVERK